MRKKKTAMECLQQAYPGIDKEVLGAALAAAEGSVSEAMEVLRENLGDHDRLLIDDTENNAAHAHGSGDEAPEFVGLWFNEAPDMPQSRVAHYHEAEVRELSEVSSSFAMTNEIAIIFRNICRPP
jgi:hypothetical protein